MDRTASSSNALRPRNPMAHALRGRARFVAHVAASGKRYRRRPKHAKRVFEAEKGSW